MEIDKTTLTDLNIFDREDEFSVFNKINCTLTGRGKEQLYKNLTTPLPDIAAIKEVQQTIQYIINKKNDWPIFITNGTIMVVERFYESSIDPISSQPGSFSSFSYKLFHGQDFSLVKYSIKHCFDFINGMQQVVHFFLVDACPYPLKKKLEEVKKITEHPAFEIIAAHKQASDLTDPEMLQLANFIRYTYKTNMKELLSVFAELDAWYGMAMATEKYKLAMPHFTESGAPVFEAAGLYNLMLTAPVSYDIALNRNKNFLFLTGANMAGKSTFIKACGTTCYLAHTGMGVPARDLTLSYFDGIHSNINVSDNIAKGESYFFNEVQRIKATIQKVSSGKSWLILIDELFKGTNVEDAMKCSSAVTEGFLKIKDSLFILSTHLYEIGESIKSQPNISCNYFETSVKDDKMSFSFQLKEGISNDRLGYLILKKEGVVKMLDDLK